MKNLSFIFAALFMFSVSLVSCSEDDASIDVVSMDEGVTADGGKWLTANFYKPGLQLTCYHWLAVSENAYEYYFETNQQEYIVVRFSADSGTPKASARTSETLPESVNDEHESVNDEHGTVNYSLEISNIAAAVTMVINGQKIKAVISVSPDKGTFGDI